MDVIMLLWVLLWGTLPPICVGYWAYKQGLQGRKEAFALRDEAIQKAEAVRESTVKAIDGIRVELKRIEKGMDTSVLREDLKASMLQSFNGSLGNLRKDMSALEERIDKALEVIGKGDRNASGGGDPIADKVMHALMGRLLG